MLINIAPLRKSRDYRLLFFGQVISFLGSMLSYVAIPYQIYALTKNNAIVGAVSLVQLVPVLVFGILGGTYADRLNRRKLLLISECLMALSVLCLFLNSLSEHPSVWLIFTLVAFTQSVLGFHRPSMEALTQSLVERVDYAAIGALNSFRFSFGAISGPALGGLLIAVYGVKATYFINFLTYGAAFTSLWLMKSTPNPRKGERSPLAEAREGMAFAVSKPELMGTYIIDIVAMIFAFPVALFPAMSVGWGGARAAGILFSAMATGSMVTTIFSGWTSEVRLHGRGVVISASLWALFMVGVGYAGNLWMAFLFLALAGGADMMSGIFRGVIWNETVPNTFRGRLAGIEMISYMTGPLLGNARAGWVAERVSVRFSLISGGMICVLAVIATALFLPRFWAYRGGKTTV
jgi:MFS family permease